jgi:hypothetical protein
VSDQWLYSRRGRTFGPVSADDIRRLAETGEIGPDDLIWRRELDAASAAPAASVLVFFLTGGKPTRPPPPPAAPAPDWVTGPTDLPSPEAAAPPDWLADVRRAEESASPPGPERPPPGEPVPR